jgi:hypothetical protein
MSQGEAKPDMYLSNSISMVPLERGMLVWPNNSSIFLSNLRHVEKLGKTDDCLNVDDLCSVVHAAPWKATGDMLHKVWLLQYSDIFGDNSGFELAIYQQVLTSFKIVLWVCLMYWLSHYSAIHQK